jgi:hypothetical protein
MTFSPKTHNGAITVHNPKTEGHRTFLIRTMARGAYEGKRIVMLLIGPNREDNSSWMWFGFATEQYGISVFRSKRGNGKPSSFEKLARILNAPKKGEKAGLRFLFEGRCRRCNRKLTTPTSIESGMGPVCAGRA